MWYVVAIKLSNCAYCGRFIITIGELMENSTDLVKYREVTDVPMTTTGFNLSDDLQSDLGLNSKVGPYLNNDIKYRYVFNETTALTLFGDDPNVVYENEDIEISDTLYMDIGLHEARVWTQNRKRVLYLSSEESSGVLQLLNPLSQVYGNNIIS